MTINHHGLLVSSNRLNTKTMQSNKEIWKDVVGYEGYYQVSTLGNVKNAKGLILKPSKQHGYPSISLTKLGILKRVKIHRLVAVAFIPNSENKPCVNHIDSVRHNNNVKNLEWVTYQENTQHAFKAGRFDHIVYPPDTRPTWICKYCKVPFKAYGGIGRVNNFCSRYCAMKHRNIKS